MIATFVTFRFGDDFNDAKAFFTDQLLEGVTALYGVRPSVEFAELAALVDNHSHR